MAKAIPIKAQIEDGAVSSNGEVTLTLGGTKVILQPTVKTLRGLSTIYSSLYTLSMNCAQFNFNAICDVIQIAADGDDGDDRATLEQAVFEYGVQRISSHIVTFVQILLNGGKPLPKTAELPKGDAGGKD